MSILTAVVFYVLISRAVSVPGWIVWSTTLSVLVIAGMLNSRAYETTAAAVVGNGLVVIAIGGLAALFLSGLSRIIRR